jgi:uncharacterized protein YjdB
MKKKVKLIANMLAIATFAIMLASCEESKNDDNTDSVIKIKSVKLSRNATTLVAGEKDTLTAMLRPTDAPEETLIWSSSNDTVATVVSIGALSGEVRSLSAGTAIITVKTSNRMIDICEVTVTNLIPLAGISIVPKGPIQLETGATDTLIAVKGPANATYYNPVWSSSNTNAVTVSKTGVITAVGTGTATVTVSSGDISTSVEITVVAALESITITPGELIRFDAIGDFLQLTATPNPSNAMFNPVWTSSDENVVTVSQTGFITGIADGESTVTVTSESVKKSVVVSVGMYRYVRDEWTANSRNGNHNWADLGDCGPGEDFSSGCSGTAGGEPEKVLDGNTWTGWHSNPDYSLPQCLVVDMKTSNVIDRIMLTHRPDALEHAWIYFQTIEVYLSDTPVTPNVRQASWGEPVAVYHYPGGINPVIINFDSSVQGRYLILFFPDSNSEPHISFSELNVYKYR